MIRIAIVEDDEMEAKVLTDALKRFEKEREEKFVIERFTDAFSYLESKNEYAVVFMDIMLPNMTGMEAASHLRKRDRDTFLIFVTSMTELAINGYEVDAIDYMIKPVSYERIERRMSKILEKCKDKCTDVITMRTEGGYVHLSTDQIYYVEVRGHKLTFVTSHGNFTKNGSIKEVEERLKESRFLRCNSCYLVNPQHINATKGYIVSMRNGDELKISQPRKKDFMNELISYLGDMQF